MTQYVDNTPNYYTSRPPEYKGLEFVIVGRSTVSHYEPDEATDPTEQHFMVEIRKTEGCCDVRDVKTLLNRALTPSRCYCEYDCCGHRHGFASVEFVNMGAAWVTVTTARNY